MLKIDLIRFHAQDVITTSIPVPPAQEEEDAIDRCPCDTMGCEVRENYQGTPYHYVGGGNAVCPGSWNGTEYVHTHN